MDEVDFRTVCLNALNDAVLHPGEVNEHYTEITQFQENSQSLELENPENSTTQFSQSQYDGSNGFQCGSDDNKHSNMSREAQVIEASMEQDGGSRMDGGDGGDHGDGASFAYPCAVCHKHYSNYSSLKRHMLDHEEQDHVCGKCGARFSKAAALKYHLKHHDGARPYVCQLCAKGFKSVHHLKVHMAVHSTEKPHVCRVCTKGFARSCSLREHMKTHSDVRKYRCDLCGKCFKSAAHLKTHHITHTGEKPHKCQVCGKGFGRQHSLKTHMIMHTGEKKHPCPQCGKAFRSATHLKDHMITHTGERPFPCQVCGKAFSRSTQLKSHLYQHLGVTPFNCDVCRMKFVTNSDLKHHNKMYHPRQAAADAEELQQLSAAANGPGKQKTPAEVESERIVSDLMKLKQYRFDPAAAKQAAAATAAAVVTNEDDAAAAMIENVMNESLQSEEHGMLSNEENGAGKGNEVVYFDNTEQLLDAVENSSSNNNNGVTKQADCTGQEVQYDTGSSSHKTLRILNTLQKSKTISTSFLYASGTSSVISGHQHTNVASGCGNHTDYAQAVSSNESSNPQNDETITTGNAGDNGVASPTEDDHLLQDALNDAENIALSTGLLHDPRLLQNETCSPSNDLDIPDLGTLPDGSSPEKDHGVICNGLKVPLCADQSNVVHLAQQNIIPGIVHQPEAAAIFADGGGHFVTDDHLHNNVDLDALNIGMPLNNHTANGLNIDTNHNFANGFNYHDHNNLSVDVKNHRDVLPTGFNSQQDFAETVSEISSDLLHQKDGLSFNGNVISNPPPLFDSRTKMKTTFPSYSPNEELLRSKTTSAQTVMPQRPSQHEGFKSPLVASSSETAAASTKKRLHRNMFSDSEQFLADGEKLMKTLQKLPSTPVNGVHVSPGIPVKMVFNKPNSHPNQTQLQNRQGILSKSAPTFDVNDVKPILISPEVASAIHSLELQQNLYQDSQLYKPIMCLKKSPSGNSYEMDQKPIVDTLGAPQQGCFFPAEADNGFLEHPLKYPFGDSVVDLTMRRKRKKKKRKRDHPRYLPNDADSIHVICELCGDEFFTMTSLSKHVKLHKWNSRHKEKHLHIDITSPKHEQGVTC